MCIASMKVNTALDSTATGNQIVTAPVHSGSSCLQALRHSGLQPSCVVLVNTLLPSYGCNNYYVLPVLIMYSLYHSCNRLAKRLTHNEMHMYLVWLPIHLVLVFTVTVYVRNIYKNYTWCVCVRTYVRCRKYGGAARVPR